MPELISLTIDHAPNKTTYFVGDRFERYGMVVKAHYDDGSSSTIDFYMCSPTNPLTLNDTQITVSFMDKSVTQSITVINPPSTGYFINKCLDKANYGNNPYVNTVDGSISFYNSPITIERDSYQLNVILSYHSRMTDKESDLIKGFYKGFRTNYHQFLAKDGKDNDNNDIYKYIDGNGYIHTFLYNEETNLYHDKEGRYLILNITNRTITDAKDNVYTFDTSGRLISIQSGLNSSDIKIIEYNSDGLRKIYDNRNPNVYIKFSYNFSFLLYIRAYYNDDNNPLKTYTFNGLFGQITSITESVGNNTRTLYEYLYNDREKVRRIVDHLNHTAYRLTYDFDTVLNDYRFNSIRQGYMSNDSLIEQKGIYFVRRNVNTIDPYKPIYELVINNDNRFKTSFMSDTNCETVSAFESVGNYTNVYKTLTKEVGKRLNFQDSSGDDGSINGKKVKSFSSLLTINEGLASDDLDSYEHIKLCGYIKIMVNVQRAKLLMDSSTIFSDEIDINPNARYVWQYFEVPFRRIIHNGSPHAFVSFTLEAFDQNDEYFEASICNLRFVKCEAKQRLFFLNNNEPVVFDNITSIKLEQENGAYQSIYLTTDVEYLTEIDLINTLKRFYSHNDEPSLLYLNNGKIIRAFCGDFYAPISSSTPLYFLEDDVSNDYLGQSNNWFFATSLDAKTKTYYRFKQNYYEIIVRNEIIDNNNQTRYIDDISKYNYQDQLLENRKTYFDDSYNQSITTTTYQYFDDGQIKKIYQTNGTETIVLYEATYLNNNQTLRKTSGLQSVDVSYNNYLENVITKNTVNGASIANSLYTKQISYDNYLQDVSSIAFKYNNENRGTNSVSQNGLTATLSVNNNPLYQLTYNETNNTSTFKRYNGTSYDNVLSVHKERFLDDLTYFDYTNVVVSNIYDDYGALLCQELNGDEMIGYCYASHVESDCVVDLNIVIDDLVVDGHTVYTYLDYNQTSKSLENINFYNHKFDILFDETNEEIIYRFGDSIYDQIKYTYKNDKVIINYDSNSTVFTTRITTFDKFGRLDSNIRADSIGNISKYSYMSNSNLLNKFEFKCGNTVIYKEIYTYDNYGNISGKTYSNKVQPWSDDYSRSYSYDGFGRIVSETTPSINATRSYSYDSQGRMTSFGNTSLTYNSKNQLSSFGNINYAYDNYGNRVSKDDIEYEYERGHLLKSVKLNNYETISFTYDYAGRRYQKLVNDDVVSTFYYDGNTLIGEDRSDGTKLRFVYDNTGIVGFRLFRNNQFEEYDYIKNPFGVIVGIFDGEHIIAQYDYDAWGKPYILWQNTSLVGAINPIKYKGYYYDDDINLYYLISRYYDCEIGQFISPDDYNYLAISSISGFNLYAYCNNNPVAYYDPVGHISELAYWLFGGLIVAGSIVLTIATNGAAWPILVGATIGGLSGGFFGGADFSNGFSWNWKNAAKGFAWGSAGGALSGAVGMGASSFFSAAGSNGFLSTINKFVINGLSSMAFSKLESIVENDDWTLARMGTTFLLGGLGSLFGKGVVSSIAWGVGFSLTEGGTGELLDYYSLTALPKLYYAWWRFLWNF